MMLLSAGTSGIGSLIGGMQSAKANREMEGYVTGMKNKNDAWYNKNYNTNYLDTDEAKSAIRVLLDQMKENNEASESSGAITGATAEKNVALKGEQNKGFSTALTRLAGYGTQRKQMIESQYMNRDSQIDQAKLGILSGKAQNGTQFSQNAQGVGQNMLLGSMVGGGGEGGQTLMEQLSALFGNSTGRSYTPNMSKFNTTMLNSPYAKPKSIF